MADQPMMPPAASYQASPRAGLAIAALVLGVLGFCIPGLGLIGVILGIVAAVRASNDPARHGGLGIAIGGICAGGLSLVVIPLMIAILLPSLARARELAKRTVCQTNMQVLSTALLTYAAENNGAFPDDPAKALGASGISPRHLQCPSNGGQSNYRYIPGWSTDDRPNTPLVYEPIDNHGGEGGNILFVDGHGEFVNQLRWSQLVQPYESKSVAISLP